MDIFNVLTLFGGLAMFLYGMKIMGNGIKESASGSLKSAMESVTNNAFKAFLLGTVITAIIQSSTATIVITCGLVGAGVLTLHQSLGIIVGAKVGTTITGQMIRLMDIDSSSGMILQFFKPSTLAPIALIIGIILLMSKERKNSHTVGTILMGFGILFTGLLSMTDAVDVLSETGVFDSMFTMLGNNSFLGYGIGVVISFILQSASATIGILQSFSMSGQLTFHAVYPVIVGVYLGDCVTTAIVACIGAKAEARRVAITNVVYNIFETFLVFIGIAVLYRLGFLDSIWDAVATPGMIANANTIFNLVSALAIMPFMSLLEKAGTRLVKDDPVETVKYGDKLEGLNPTFVQTPAIALKSCYDVLSTMFVSSRANIENAILLLRDYDEETLIKIKEEEDNIDMLADRLSGYLELLSTSLHNPEHVSILNQYYSDVNEFERLGDYAMNVAEIAEEMHKKNITFSNNAFNEVDVLTQLLENILNESETAFQKRDLDCARAIEPLEEVVDDMVEALKSAHLERLKNGMCNAYSGAYFLELLSNLERISDVCSNIGLATLARVQPEITSTTHDYASSLHSGHDENFNQAYASAHEEYFNRLEEYMKKDRQPIPDEQMNGDIDSDIQIEA